MRRTLYFVLALVFAAFFMLGAFFGFSYGVYQLTTLNRTLEEAMNHGTGLTFIVSSIGLLGWIVCAYLFVQEDERIEIEEEQQARLNSPP